MPGSGDNVAKVCAGLFGEGICSTGTEANVTWKGGSPKALGVTKLGSEYQYLATSHSWPCVYVGGWKRQMLPAVSSVPVKIPQQSLLL